ncbi:histidine ammonia-lyase [Algoriphagus sp.]|uniref:histidine ammonia-lyase n=1 Tax=Algoriphagus sp. TaxID=1872435 RepID=UPI002625336C|nr:histidine ammonia-lyase [Algoriphagus sp.]
MKTFHFGKDRLTASLAIGLARKEITGVLSLETLQKVQHSAKAVEKIAKGDRPVYGINTGFGPLCTSKISTADTQLLQENLLKSHSVGVGEPVDPEITKLMMVLKIHALAQGFSGIRLETLQAIRWMLEKDIIPLVPIQGSVGASGDLAPLSHLFLPLIGLGQVSFEGKIQKMETVLNKFNRPPVQLGPKEGLALINGTQFMAAHGVIVVAKLHNLLSHASISGAMMIEGLMGSIKPFLAELHQLRPFSGNQHVAQTILHLLHQSEILASHLQCERVQDPYSLRCIPQVHGASWNAFLHLKEAIETEINSVTDNPVVFNPEHTISGGNFHGQPIALPLDYATLAASEIGNIADRRIYLSIEGTSPGVPKLLLNQTGLNSGLMIPQYTTAALASENKGLCFPASADSIPTSLGQEDHVSMGSIGARKALRVIENVEKILGIELLYAAQAMDFHAPLRSGKILTAIHQHIRERIQHVDSDRILYEDIQTAIDLVKGGDLLHLAKEVADRQGLTFETAWTELFSY